jgi:hypothetical protein
MSASSMITPSILKALTAPDPATSISVPVSSNAQSRAALKRCCAAWKRAFDACMKDPDDDGDCVNEMFAAKEAGEAYCSAMPMLDGYQGIRDFIACTAHGILIGAIPQDRSGRLLYAAQVALTFLQQESRSSKPRTKKSSAKKPRK